MKLLISTKFEKKLQRSALVSITVIMLGGCGASDLAGLESDTFFAQAMPTWFIPTIRDDYMGKKYLQPNDVAKSTAYNEQGEVVADPSLWSWPRGWPWPWPLPSPSPPR